MNYQSLEQLRRRLHARRSTLRRASDHAVAEAAALRTEREPDWPDAAALATSAALLEALSDTERAELARVDDALTRLERGTYGVCVTCGVRIELDRLEAVPETDRCARCAEH